MAQTLAIINKVLKVVENPSICVSIIAVGKTPALARLHVFVLACCWRRSVNRMSAVGKQRQRWVKQSRKSRGRYIYEVFRSLSTYV